MPKNGFKVVRASYTVYDYLPKMYRHYGDGMLRENGEIAEFDIWADDWETVEYYNSILEQIGISIDYNLDEPTETLKESVSSHQQMKTTRKSNKKKSREQRAKKKSNRLHKIIEFENDDITESEEEAIYYTDSN